MSERIRIDVSDVARAPDAPSEPIRTQASPAVSGDVFGTVQTLSSQTGVASGGIWTKPKLLFALAGFAAAVLSSITIDGIAGFGRCEASGVEPPFWMPVVFMGSFCAIATAFIAAADDLVSGALGRAAILASIGTFLGLLGGVVALIAGGLVIVIIHALVYGNDWQASSEGELLIYAIVGRTPGWLILGALCGLVIGALGRSSRRALLGCAGGAVGGLAGGLLFDPLNALFGGFQPGSDAVLSRFIALSVTGAATGFAIAFAEQAGKQAWLSIERGRLIGKQFIIYRNPTRVGASYSNDVFLFKDATVLPEHARILRRSGGYFIEALAGALVRVNGQPSASRSLGNGDTVQIGETVMRFSVKS